MNKVASIARQLVAVSEHVGQEEQLIARALELGFDSVLDELVAATPVSRADRAVLRSHHAKQLRAGWTRDALLRSAAFHATCTDDEGRAFLARFVAMARTWRVPSSACAA